MGRKILALIFLNPAIMQQGIQSSIMPIYIANMPVDSSTDECDELWKRGIMKFRLQICISNTWPQFLFFLYQLTHWRYNPLGQSYTESVCMSEFNNTLKILLSLSPTFSLWSPPKLELAEKGSRH